MIDLNFQDTPGVIATYILDTGDGLAVVDTGPTSTLPALSAGLEALGASLSDVRHLLLTHIHFDHAGAAGTILSRVPEARVYVHERGAKHLASPERLVASATQIYGDAMDRLWGEMLPIPAEKMTVLAGGETLQLGEMSVDALYTPGHAVHHLAYHIGPDLFVGDVGGVRLDTRQTARAPTPPPDINLEAWKDSVATLRERDAQTLHVAHFGSHPHETAHWDGLLEKMDLDAGRIRAGLEAGQEFETISEAYTKMLMQELLAEGEDLPARYDFACPPWMSVQGLMRYWQKKAVRP
ncbi:MBL fold metallo-hydrolase [Deinococcus arenicola]|uniref:MBL fold metallo-hydrolase n=1 Tax=Deinococcus arenicola TaxID=2994950 RepID=A0ABU4DQI4_9DEIO|nr:MBL fold metallo-hydrolase [Deinococcus sp. ZS9-10]MDV6374691.1 MBL fold metallo-hydrolase [Deinococcus sp. ZS9-10]